ncbi:deoxynucleoside kinase [Singapore grouper iridovirus]|uniref:Deoxynucleoside kinase n=1 Tax=Singapore grouper iridovirus TaxID=262968 RepID=Q5YFJ8_9VIRU|nr:deoxynucleoside kinase [Singapore grouper iridovirus]AAS18082.1 deoxynucleoside kinase [Singapore grouper iridovirus]WAU86776.1 deoxynucleoside kinase [Singapore grouper iridovirus]
MALPFLISVSGNIGAGKSSLLAALAKRGYYVQPEDFTKWGPLFNLALAEPKRYKFSSQLKILMVQMDLQREHRNGTRPLVILERASDCVLGFGKVAYDMGLMHVEEYRMLEDIHAKLDAKVDLKILLDTPPDVCRVRIGNRDREFEQAISNEYLTALHAQFIDAADVKLSGLPPKEEVVENFIKLLAQYNL